MATITLEYDGRNVGFRKLVEAFIALGAKVSTPKKAKKLTDVEISMKEVREGKINTYKTPNDLFRKLGI